MNRDDFMEALLLRAARVACVERGWQLIAAATGTYVVVRPGRSTEYQTPTDLLRDLGADVPEWPSAEKTQATREEFIEGNGGDPEALSLLAHWIVDDPLDVLALLLPEAAR